MSPPFNIKSNKNFLFTAVIVFLTSLMACTGKPKLTTTEALVNNAVNTLKILKERTDLEEFNSQLKKAAGVAIFPSVYRAGFFVGAEAGNGILIAKNNAGEWGYPAFYSLASGSWGLQFGGQKSGTVFIIRNAGAVEALIEYQGKVSSGMDATVGNFGTSLKGGITANLAADIIAYSDTKGLFSGVSIEGSAMIRRNDLNSEYYGEQAHPKDIVIKQIYKNSHANILRHNLSK